MVTEQENKRLGTEILIAEATVKQAGGKQEFQKIGNLTVRGRASPVTLFCV